MMECLACKTDMECYDDVVYTDVRIDWIRCPKCGSKGEIEYNPRTNEMVGFKWEKKKNV